MSKTVERPKRLLIGMSHVIAIAAASTPEDRMTFVNLNEHPDLYDKERRSLKAQKLTADGADEICLLMGGNMHNILGLLNHPVPFSVGAALAADDPLLDGRTIIPEPVMRAVMADRLEFLFRLTREIHARFTGVAFKHMAPPPPMATLDAVKRQPPIIRDKMHLGLSPKPVRKALYDMQCSLYAEQAALNGAPYLACPEAALDAEGFLAPPYCSDDPTHANAAYGRLVLDALHQDRERP